MAFHYLTVGKSIPPGTHSILGLGLKFIPTLPSTMGPRIVEEDFDRFERDVDLKVYFAGETDDKIAEPTKLYIKSTWRAPFTTLDVDGHQHKFVRQLC